MFVKEGRKKVFWWGETEKEDKKKRGETEKWERNTKEMKKDGIVS